MDHIETKILNSYTIQEAAQNMVFAARLFQEAAWQQKGWSANFRLLIPDIEEKFMPSSVMLVQNPKYSAKIPV